MQTFVVSFDFGSETQSVALYEGLSTEELQDILQAVFSFTEKVVGFVNEDKVVIPIALACKSPGIIPKSCRVLLHRPASSPAAVSSSKPAPPSSPSSAEITPKATPVKSVNSSESKTSPLKESPKTPMYGSKPGLLVGDTEQTTREILRFVTELRTKKFISSAHFNVLEEMVFNNSCVLYAAYSVALAADDSEYFARLCEEFATTMETKDGRSVCEAQDEMLHLCDAELFSAGLITENQLLYLRHLILIRDDQVADIYDELQQSGELSGAIRSLQRVVQNHAKRGTVGATNAAGVASSSETHTNKLDLGTVLATLLSRDLVTRHEATKILELARKKSPYIKAALELFEIDGKLEDLCDTLLRCVRLDSHQVAEDEDDDVEEDDDDDNKEDEEEEDNVADESSESNDVFYGMDLRTILAAQDISINPWLGLVPERFLKAIFFASYRKMLSLTEAKAICDLFEDGHELVKAAWEVYLVDADLDELADTLRRIIRSRIGESSEEKDVKTAKAETSEEKHNANAGLSRKSFDLLKYSLEMMVKGKIIDQNASDSLMERAVKGDSLVDAAIEAYANDRDVAEFLDTLQILANSSAEELDELAGNEGEDEEDESASDEEDAESDDGENDDSANKPSASFSSSMNRIRINETDINFPALSTIVADLIQANIVQGEDSARLIKLLRENDSRLRDVYQKLRRDSNFDEFVDAIVELSENKKATASTATTTQKFDSAPTQAWNISKDKDMSSSRESTLNVSDQKSVVEILSRAGAVTSAQAMLLNRLIEERDAVVLSIFRKYEQEKDVHKLITDLKALHESSQKAADIPFRSPMGRRSAGSTTSSVPSSTAATGASSHINSRLDGVDGDDDNVGDDEEDLEDSYDAEADVSGSQGDDGSPPKTASESSPSNTESRFSEVVSRMKLTHLESAALRLALAKGDPKLQQALNNYKQDLNDTALLNALRSLSRSIIAETMQSKGFSSTISSDSEEEEDAEDDLEEENERDYHIESDNSGKDSKEKAGHAETPSDTESSDGDEEDEDEDEDEDNTEEENNGRKVGLSSASTRKQVFPILINELVKETILTPADGRTLLALFQQDDKEISVALDTYDADNDMANLVNVLQSLVDKNT